MSVWTRVVVVLSAFFIGACNTVPEENAKVTSLGDSNVPMESSAGEERATKEIRPQDPHVWEIPFPEEALIDSRELADAHESIFRYQFQNNPYKFDPLPKAYFLSVLGSDPSRRFLKRFEGHQPPVHVGSRFEIGLGLKYFITSFRLRTKEELEVFGGFTKDEMMGFLSVYQLLKLDGKWVVVNWDIVAM